MGPQHLWQRDEALTLCERLESAIVLADAGYHVALAGSVLYRGWSDKDLDVIVYVRGSVCLYRSKLNEALRIVGLTPAAAQFEGAHYDRLVEVWEYNGKRVDLLFLS